MEGMGFVTVIPDLEFKLCIFPLALTHFGLTMHICFIKKNSSHFPNDTYHQNFDIRHA